MLQADAPDVFEDSHAHPSLEAQVTGAAGTVLARNHLPLTSGAQYVKDAIEHGTVQHRRPAIGAAWFVRRQDGFDQVPQVIGNLAESIPLRFFRTHRQVLHDFTIKSSATMHEAVEGF